MKICIQLCGKLSELSGSSFIMLDVPGGQDLVYTVKHLVKDESGEPLKDILLTPDGGCNEDVKVCIENESVSWSDTHVLKDAMNVILDY